MKTSIIILVRNQLDYTKQCIESIRQFTRPGTYEIIVVDNGSDDGTSSWLAEQQDLVNIRNEFNAGFPAGCNQGIARSTGQYILLLNNDTIVTRNWLDNLLNCLESDETIGAVGPVTNNCSYYQAISVNYSTLAEMHAFAEHFNRPDPRKWEERLKLVGFCMLIKRSVIEKIGLLDEWFTPGNYEDDDLSLRMVEAGFRLMLCRDTFIHHYGSVSFKENAPEYLQLLTLNEQKFQEKWSFQPINYLRIDYELADRFVRQLPAQPRLLQIGTGCGGTMLWLKNIVPRAMLYGVERNPRARQIASKFMYMYDHWDRLLAEGLSFDAIFISHFLHEMSDPADQLARIKALLKPDGSLFISALNSLYYQNIVRLVQGLPTIPEARYHAAELSAMLAEAGFDIIANEAKAEVPDAHRSIVDMVCILGKSGEEKIYESKSYFIHARPQSSLPFASLLERLDDRPDLPEVLDALMAYDADEIADAIAERFPRPVEKLNWMAIACFQYGQDDRVLPFLNRGYELDPIDRDTVYNLAYVLHQWGHRDLALQYLEKTAVRDEEMEALYREIAGIHHDASLSDRQLTYWIRRMEYGIDAEASAAELRRAIMEDAATFEKILDVIKRESSNPNRLLEMLQGFHIDQDGANL